jgi:[ribosomal protein S18]-alanine N-acetyltransferase
MSAQLQPAAQACQPMPMRAMTVADLDAVLAIENAAYAFPWTRGNFTDSLAAGYRAQLLLPRSTARRVDRAELPCLGYCVAMPGFEEMHLLNITVHPEHQGQGLARQMLSHLGAACVEQGLATLWLEVRQSNLRAQRLYQQWGFLTVGVRRGYYPHDHGRREDAIVMRLNLPRTPEPPHGLD